MDVAEWLPGLGLEQYGPAFRDIDIDGEVLRGLTADDLRELGVASIGHRRRLLDAIARFVDGPPSTEASPPPRGSRLGSPLVLSRVHWARPELVAEVKFLAWTEDNLLRQVVYEGLREDKPPREVRREMPRI